MSALAENISETLKQNFLVEKQLKIHWLIEMGIENYNFSSNGLINVAGDVNLSNKGLKDLPYQFGKVEGKFDISDNDLHSLKGVPFEVGGDFNCSKNRLVEVLYAPRKIGGSFDCSKNSLKSLELGPLDVGKNYICSNNKLTSLKEVIDKINGFFDCSFNYLTSLKYSPKIVNSFYSCLANKLVNLDYAPKEVLHQFNCSNNELERLRHIPKLVEKIVCHDNPIEDLSIKTHAQRVEVISTKELNSLDGVLSYVKQNNAVLILNKSSLDKTDSKELIQLDKSNIDSFKESNPQLFKQKQNDSLAVSLKR